MPSCAFQKFENNLLQEVYNILDSHYRLNHVGKGRRGLGHITRSGVLMLCAAWELYLEELLLESVQILTERAEGPRDLPKKVYKEIAHHVRSVKDESKPLDMAGDGWKNVFESHAKNGIGGINTPKSTQIDPLFEKYLGLEELSSCWSYGKGDIDHFVSIRGDIAHRGRDAGYVHKGTLTRYKEVIYTSCIETDNHVADYIRDNPPSGNSPWYRRH
jgi:hypothetical protein